MILKIYKWPSEKLREVADSVSDSIEDIQQLVADLFETMYDDQGIGLSATQCGIKKRVLVIDTSQVHQEGRKLSMINPVIVEGEGKITSTEGCLSFPKVFADISRIEKITVRYLDSEYQEHVETFTGLESVCIQHEMDHLEGKVFVDYLSSLKRDRLIKKMKKLNNV